MIKPSNITSFTQARVQVLTKVKEDIPTTPGEAGQALLSRGTLSCRGQT